MVKKHSLWKSFGYAFEGLATAFKTEANFRIQVAIGLTALVFSVLLGFSWLETVVLLTVIALVLVFELVNTIIELLAGEEISLKAKTIKDVSAAAVVLVAFLSLIVGAFLFFPKILQKWILPL